MRGVLTFVIALWRFGSDRDSNSQNGSSLGSVSLHPHTLSHSSWPTPLQAFALVMSPRLRLWQNGNNYFCKSWAMEVFNIVYHTFVQKILKVRKIINKWPRISPFDYPHEEVRSIAWVSKGCQNLVQLKTSL
jgi:hypothetical protein